jgi:hypothetical protein
MLGSERKEEMLSPSSSFSSGDAQTGAACVFVVCTGGRMRELCLGLSSLFRSLLLSSPSDRLCTF